MRPKSKKSMGDTDKLSESWDKGLSHRDLKITMLNMLTKTKGSIQSFVREWETNKKNSRTEKYKNKNNLRDLIVVRNRWSHWKINHEKIFKMKHTDKMIKKYIKEHKIYRGYLFLKICHTFICYTT